MEEVALRLKWCLRSRMPSGLAQHRNCVVAWLFGCVPVTHSTCSYKFSRNEEVESLNQAWHEEMSVACVVCSFVLIVFRF